MDHGGRRRRGGTVVALAALAALAGCGDAAGRAAPSAPGTAVTTSTTSAAPAAGAPAASVTPSAGLTGDAATAAAPDRLAGFTVVLDPGHQLGNSRHPAKVNRVVDAGNGVRKACNTTGTSTNGGYPESRFTMRVARATKKKLEAMGAKVVLTRPREDVDLWGPCIGARARIANRAGADAFVSIHADGAPASARGFHVIRPKRVDGWTDDIAAPSRRLAVAVHGALVDAGLPPARYIGSRDGYDVRGDLGTLNWSDRPVVMVELGNMRNAAEARRLTDPDWQRDVAASALAAGIAEFLAG